MRSATRHPTEYGPGSSFVLLSPDRVLPAGINLRLHRPVQRPLPPVLVTALLMALGSGCKHAPYNVSRPSAPPGAGYYFQSLVADRVNHDKTLFLVAFSGGGTRAASMAYGVLEELRATPLDGTDQPRRMIDEIDVISSVSGGSFTAAAYALYGDDLFGQFETNFLKRDVQGKLVGKTFSPWNWPGLLSPWYGRSDIAAEYYDRILFHGATYGDLIRKGGPFVVVNATELGTGFQFAFTQNVFDNLCSDLSGYPLSRAVAASSAVPVALSPITLKNYAGTCELELPSWTLNQDGAQDDADLNQLALSSRPREWAALRDRAKLPYLHLVDGGVADNLGLRPLMDGLAILEGIPHSREGLKFDAIERVVLVAVNARSSPENDWDKRESPPGMLTLAIAAPAITMERYSRDTVNLMQAMVRQWETKLGKTGSGRIRFYPIVLSFDDLPDADERRYFMNVPTSFFLTDEAVDRLRDVGGRLLRDSPQFQALVQDLNGHR